MQIHVWNSHNQSRVLYDNGTRVWNCITTQPCRDVSGFCWRPWVHQSQVKFVCPYSALLSQNVYLTLPIVLLVIELPLELCSHTSQVWVGVPLQPSPCCEISGHPPRPPTASLTRRGSCTCCSGLARPPLCLQLANYMQSTVFRYATLWCIFCYFWLQMCICVFPPHLQVFLLSAIHSTSAWGTKK